MNLDVKKLDIETEETVTAGRIAALSAILGKLEGLDQEENELRLAVMLP